MDDLRVTLGSIRGRTIVSRLRPLLPEIDRRIREGVQHQEILEALNHSGGLGRPLKLATLRSYLSRYRKSLQALGRAGDHGGSAAMRASVSSTNSSANVGDHGSRPVVTPTTIRKARTQDIDLEELARLARTSAKEGVRR